MDADAVREHLDRYEENKRLRGQVWNQEQELSRLRAEVAAYRERFAEWEALTDDEREWSERCLTIGLPGAIARAALKALGS